MPTVPAGKQLLEIPGLPGRREMALGEDLLHLVIVGLGVIESDSHFVLLYVGFHF